MKALALSSLSALAIQPAVFVLWFGLPLLASGEQIGSRNLAEFLQLIVLVIVIAAVHLIVLGIPTFLALKRWRHLNWRSVLLAGFICGSIVIAVVGWPLHQGTNYSSSAMWHGAMRDMEVNGFPTIYGWLQYAEGVAAFGAHGIVGASVYYCVWRRHAT